MDAVDRELTISRWTRSIGNSRFPDGPRRWGTHDFPDHRVDRELTSSTSTPLPHLIQQRRLAALACEGKVADSDDCGGGDDDDNYDDDDGDHEYIVVSLSHSRFMDFNY